MNRETLLSRQIALDFLNRLSSPEMNTHPLFDTLMKRSDISDLDKAFVRALVLSTLRHMGQIDFVLSQLLEKPLPIKLTEIRMILRMGAAQLLFLRVPAHAVVDTSVELAKPVRAGAFSKLVNGVLRALERRQNDFQNIPAQYNWPHWLWTELKKAYGPDLAEKLALCALNESPVDLTVRDNPRKWAAQLDGLLLPTGSVRLTKSGKVSELPGFQDGQWWVQNAAASIPAQLFLDLKGKQVADLCAAPGGKTAQLAQLGAHVSAFDISELRLKRLRENMARLSFDVQTHAVDVLTLPAKPTYDAVLLDAPCSATGTIGRHPEILMRLQKEDVARLASVQKQLLNQAVFIDQTRGANCVFNVFFIAGGRGENHGVGA